MYTAPALVLHKDLYLFKEAWRAWFVSIQLFLKCVKVFDRLDLVGVKLEPISYHKGVIV